MGQHRGTIIVLLLLLTGLERAIFMHGAHALAIHEIGEQQASESSEQYASETGDDTVARTTTIEREADGEATAIVDVDNLDWLEQSLLRDVETLSRTVRHIQRRSSKQQQPLTASKQLKRSSRTIGSASDATTGERLNDFWYRNVQLPLMRMLRERAAKRSATVTSTDAVNPSSANEKRPQRASGSSVMQLCHFKICSMGKRSVRSVREAQPQQPLAHVPLETIHE